MWHVYRVELYPHVGQLCGIRDRYGHELEFPSAFRQSRRDGTPKGIVKIRTSTMIRNENEYQEAVKRVREEVQRLRDEKSKLESMDLSKEDIKRLLDPIRSFHEQLKEEVASYERLKRGDFDELHNFEGLGRLLVALRIAKGLSQRDLADRLGVHESQVSRDERNEYHGVTVDRANRVLEALAVDLRSEVVSLGTDADSENAARLRGLRRLRAR